MIGALLALLLASAAQAGPAPAPQKAVVIELGANNGQWTAKRVEGYKTTRTEPVSCFMFEVQPKLIAGPAKQVSEQHKCELIQKAVWIQNDLTLTFEEMGNLDSVATSMYTDEGVFHSQKNPQFNVSSIDIADWFIEQEKKGVFTRNDFFHVRLDIEGAEYYVLRRLINTGVACWFDVLEFEGHALHNKKNYNKRVVDVVVPWLLKDCGVKVVWESYYPKNFHTMMIKELNDTGCSTCPFLNPKDPRAVANEPLHGL